LRALIEDIGVQEAGGNGARPAISAEAPVKTSKKKSASSRR
jgi:hypothetical protein